MRIGLVVDSACDLPQSFIEQHGIVILPITLHLGDRDEIDTRDPEKTPATPRRPGASTRASGIAAAMQAARRLQPIRSSSCFSKSW